jgi:hypothetical protein
LDQLRQRMEACHWTDHSHLIYLFCPRLPHYSFTWKNNVSLWLLWSFGIFILQFASHILDIEHAHFCQGRMVNLWNQSWWGRLLSFHIDLPLCHLQLVLPIGKEIEGC